MHIPAFAIPVARAQAGGAKAHPKVERMTGIEPVASTMASSRSTTELHPLKVRGSPPTSNRRCPAATC